MTGFAFHKNLAFELDGVPARIHTLPANGEVVIELQTTGALRVTTREALLEQYANGQVKVQQSSSHTKGGLLYSRALSELPERVRKEVIRRRAYLKGICEDGAPIFTAERMRPVLRRIAEQLGESKPPGVTTVYRWYSRFRSTDDTRSLIPRTDRRGSTTARQPDRLIELLTEAASEAYRASPLAGVKDITSRLCTKLERENHAALNSAPLTMPSLRTVYRLLDKVDAYDKAALKVGKAAADRRFRLNKLGVRTSRILKRVEIDHTPLDVFVIDDKTWLPIGRPTLTVIIDHYSRMILGYYLSFSPPSAEAVIGALRHAILPKLPRPDVLKQLEWVNDWPCYGVFESAVLDNGLEFHGIDMEGIAFDLGITLIYCPKRKPRLKGVVERFLKTINYHFAHQLPGVSFARFHQRGDYDPEKQSLLTLSEITQVIEKWIVDIYHQDKHRGIDDLPIRRWRESAHVHEPMLPANLDALKRRIGKSKACKLRRDGVVVEGIRYSSPEVQRILNKYGEGVEVKVVYDPEDMGEILLWGPNDDEPETVQAMDLAYAKGLTARQNAWIREQKRQQIKDGVNEVGLQEARENITAVIEELMASRHLRDRKRSATLKGDSNIRSAAKTTSDAAPKRKRKEQQSVPPPASSTAQDVFAPGQVWQAFELSSSPTRRRHEG